MDEDFLLAGIVPGFADQTRDSQQVFRELLEATARPGRIVTLPRVASAPEGMSRGMTALALTLLDCETGVWLDQTLATTTVIGRFLKFNCGCPLTADPLMAHFAFIGEPSSIDPLVRFRQGSDQYPDRSATLVIEVPDLKGGRRRWLTGPGIEKRHALAPAGLPERFWDDVSCNHGCFPVGIDIFFVCGDELASLPRSIRVEV